MAEQIETLAELKAAYESGQLSLASVCRLDNDDVSVYSENFGGTVFSTHPEALLEEALSLLGIPWEHV